MKKIKNLQSQTKHFCLYWLVLFKTHEDFIIQISWKPKSTGANFRHLLNGTKHRTTCLLSNSYQWEDLCSPTKEINKKQVFGKHQTRDTAVKSFYKAKRLFLKQDLNLVNVSSRPTTFTHTTARQALPQRHTVRWRYSCGSSVAGGTTWLPLCPLLAGLSSILFLPVVLPPPSPNHSSQPPSLFTTKRLSPPFPWRALPKVTNYLHTAQSKGHFAILKELLTHPQYLTLLHSFLPSPYQVQAPKIWFLPGV